MLFYLFYKYNVLGDTVISEALQADLGVILELTFEVRKFLALFIKLL